MMVYAFWAALALLLWVILFYGRKDDKFLASLTLSQRNLATGQRKIEHAIGELGESIKLTLDKIGHDVKEREKTTQLVKARLDDTLREVQDNVSTWFERLDTDVKHNNDLAHKANMSLAKVLGFTSIQENLEFAAVTKQRDAANEQLEQALIKLEQYKLNEEPKRGDITMRLKSVNEKATPLLERAGVTRKKSKRAAKKIGTGRPKARTRRRNS